MPELNQRLEQLKAKMAKVESISRRLGVLEKKLRTVERQSTDKNDEDTGDSTIWQSLEELRGFAERLSIAVTQLESEIEGTEQSLRHLETD
ncbi:hypothetical protein EU545_04615 [Candidatus Thorarchaeota archaeon]|nr:MAG: hypothetical protein EU545_04615 [Candidatus Thorarchaeota archaeon]